MDGYVERMVACGMNLIDAWEIYDDFMQDNDEEGLEEYVSGLEYAYMF